MYTIMARNVNDAYPKGIDLLQQYGIRRGSRAGEVLELSRPCTTYYQCPQERVLFDVGRDANPFFHFFEALWMLAGRGDVYFVEQFNPRMREYSDDGQTIHGAYGPRWRAWFGIDQLDKLVDLFRIDPDTRRAYLGMWDVASDLDMNHKDLPCNVGVKFEQRDGKLNMVVFNRSNDIIWGAYGANVVHLSMLQEYLAARCGFQLGWYEQVSGNYHAYTEVWNRLRLDDVHIDPLEPMTLRGRDPYALNEVQPYAMVVAPQHWDAELAIFLSKPGREGAYLNPFFDHVARPMWKAFRAWEQYRKTDMAEAKITAHVELDACLATDWARACGSWIDRRKSRQKEVVTSG